MKANWDTLRYSVKREISTELPRLVSLLNGFQVVRMVELLRTFGMCGLYQTMVLSISKKINIPHSKQTVN